MTDDELEGQEEINRALIEAMGKLSRQVQASPGFVARTMARVDLHRAPRWSRFDRVRIAGLVPALGWRLAVVGLLLLAVVGAVPQYLNWIDAYLMGVPSDTVHEARLQERLWEKNFACATQLDHGSRNYGAIIGEQIVVVAWVCPSGDVLVSMESTTDEAASRSVWIPFHSDYRTAGLLRRLVPLAFAGDHPRWARKRGAPMVTVLCQKWLPNRLIIRRVQLANGRCVDEVINPRTGRVKMRRKARCDRKC